ncbi:IS3 family transposase, partial [Saccharibacillus kuerlensis]
NTLEEARHQIADYLTYYNEERFQSKLNDLSPKEFREKVVA